MNDIYFPPQKKKRWLWKSLKIFLIAGAISVVLFTVLARLGGNSPVLRESVEQYIREATLYEPRVGRLNHMNFFPTVIIDFDNLELRPKGFKTGPSVITVQKIFLASSFWDVITHSGKVSALHVQGLQAQSGSFLEKPLTLEHLSILTNEKTGKSILRGDGSIEETPFYVSLSLEVFGKPPVQKFRIDKQKKLEAGLDDFHLSVKLVDVPGKGAEFQNLEIKKKDTDILSGNIQTFHSEGGVQIKGSLDLVAPAAQIKPDLDLQYKEKETIIRGIIQMNSEALEAFAPDAPLNKFVKIFTEKLAPAGNSQIIWDVILQTPTGKKTLQFENGILTLR